MPPAALDSQFFGNSTQVDRRDISHHDGGPKPFLHSRVSAGLNLLPSADGRSCIEVLLARRGSPAKGVLRWRFPICLKMIPAIALGVSRGVPRKATAQWDREGLDRVPCDTILASGKTQLAGCSSKLLNFLRFKKSRSKRFCANKKLFQRHRTILFANIEQKIIAIIFSFSDI
jgi:hypothetical protein